MFCSTYHDSKQVNVGMQGGSYQISQQMQTWIVWMTVGFEVTVCNWESSDYGPGDYSITLFEGPLIEAWPVYEAYARMLISGPTKEKS